MSVTNQKALFPEIKDDVLASKPVNVASVPQYSPFRYPGGKTWFVPHFRHWISSLPTQPKLLVEPFAGGGVISLAAAFENLVDKVVMVELDEEIAAVWQTIIYDDAQWLANRILGFEMTRENVAEELSRQADSIREKAFQTILKNRTLHGGILAKGSSFIKNGENRKGIGSRWYPKTLAKRILSISKIAHKITFICADGIEQIEKYSSCTDAAFFIDPPYTAGGKKAGRRLYRYHKIDHEKLFLVCTGVHGYFLMTYDNTPEVAQMAKKHSFSTCVVPMKNTHHATMLELVISNHIDKCSTMEQSDHFPTTKV